MMKLLRAYKRLLPEIQVILAIKKALTHTDLMINKVKTSATIIGKAIRCNL